MPAGQIPATATRHTALIKFPKPSGTSRVLRQPPWWGLLATLGVPPGGGFGQARENGRWCAWPRLSSAAVSAAAVSSGRLCWAGRTRSAARGRAAESVGGAGPARFLGVTRSPGGGFGCCGLGGGLLGPPRRAARVCRGTSAPGAGSRTTGGCRPLAQPAEESRDEAASAHRARGSFGCWRRLRGVTCRAPSPSTATGSVLGDADRIRLRFRFRFRLGPPRPPPRSGVRRTAATVRPRVRRLGLTDDTELIDTRRRQVL